MKVPNYACVVSIALAVATLVIGLYAAMLWFRASKIPIKPTWDREDGKEGTEPGEREDSQDGWIWGAINNIAQSSELNRRAAWWTGVAVILGTSSNLVGVLSSCF